MKRNDVILIYGHEAMLLRTRQRILEQFGYVVVLATSIDEAKQSLESEPVELLIVCQTVSDEDGRVVMALADQLRQGIKILEMSVSRQRFLKADRVTPFLVSAGPRALVDVVHRLTQDSTVDASIPIE